MPKARTLYLIDGHAQLYRAYHAHARENRRATNGTPTGALYGFFNMLRGIRKRFKPELLGCVFDPKEGSFREKEYHGYKAHRAPMPEDLRQQIPLALELCEGYGIPAVQVEDFEADDILGALAHKAVKKGLKVVVITGDKDLLQLVDGDVQVFDPMKDIEYDADTVQDLKGLRPDQIVDWLGLQGDAADNIPGVAGVGEQTAVKLLKEHDTLDKVLAHYHEKLKDREKEILAFVKEHSAEAKKDKEDRQTVKPPKGLKVVEAYLYAQAEQARASRELARIRVDAPVEFVEKKFANEEPDRERLIPLLQKLDFRQLLRELGGGEEDLLTLSEQNAQESAAANDHHVVDTPQKLNNFAKQLAKQKRFAFDTETTSTDPMRSHLVGMAFSWKKSEAWYLPVRGPGGEKLLPEKEAIEAVKEALEDPTVGKVGQHLKYDINVMRRCGVRVRGAAFDTLIAGWLLDPGALRHDLDTLAYTHLQIRKIKTGTLIGKGKPATMDLVPVADVAAYACEDADVTWQLAEVLAPKVKEAGLAKLMDEIETPLIEVLAEMEWTGVRIDAKLLQDMSGNLAEQLAAMEEDIYRQAGERFTINSPKQLGHILFEKLGLPSISKTAKGQDSTSEEVLTELALQHDLPKLIVEYRQFSKLKSTYVDALPGMVNPETGRIHATFQQTGTETGRISSNNPNLQNIPVRTEAGRSIRAAFRPGVADKDGWKIVAADYSQIELRILAHYSKDKALLDAFAKGRDIHLAVAANLFGVKEKDVTREQRARAKTVNFGVIYGQTAFGLSRTLGIPQKEAKEIIEKFFAAHPGVQKCIDEIVSSAEDNGYVTTILGRRRFVPQLKEASQRKLGERIAVNTVFQGSAADLIKKAMLEIHAALCAPKSAWKARMIMQIHDELVFEAPAGEVKKLTAFVKDTMEGALKLKVPLVVDTGAGDDWLSAKD
ncbi:MAG: DNA polymerase I [Planctomycetes bacterium]|nr:DNA polymerase I [Planctomycetota bacterium]